MTERQIPHFLKMHKFSVNIWHFDKKLQNLLLCLKLHPSFILLTHIDFLKSQSTDCFSMRQFDVYDDRSPAHSVERRFVFTVAGIMVIQNLEQLIFSLNAMLFTFRVTLLSRWSQSHELLFIRIKRKLKDWRENGTATELCTEYWSSWSFWPQLNLAPAMY